MRGKEGRQGGAARRGGTRRYIGAVGGAVWSDSVYSYRMMAGKNEKAMTTTAMTTTTAATTTVMATMNDADDSMGVELKGNRGRGRVCAV